MVNVAQKTPHFLYYQGARSLRLHIAFEVLRVTPFPEHFGVVVRLKNQVPSQCRIAVHLCGNMPHIGSQREEKSASPEVIAHIFGAIVRHIKRHYFKSRYKKPRLLPQSDEANLHLFYGSNEGINCRMSPSYKQEVILQCQGAKSFNVISMLMGDQTPMICPSTGILKGQRPSYGSSLNTGIYEQASSPEER